MWTLLQMEMSHPRSDWGKDQDPYCTGLSPYMKVKATGVASKEELVTIFS